MMLRWHPIASMVTVAPLTSISDKSFGITSSSLSFASTAVLPMTRPVSLTNAATECSGDWPERCQEACKDGRGHQAHLRAPLKVAGSNPAESLDHQ